MSRHSGASTDSRRLPWTRRPLPGIPFSTGATRSSVPSHGMYGWFQQIQASHFPSGEGVGKAKKSVPVTRVRILSGAAAAEPSSGTATIARLTLPSSCRSWTHQTSRLSCDKVKSA